MGVLVSPTASSQTPINCVDLHSSLRITRIAIARLSYRVQPWYMQFLVEIILKKLRVLLKMSSDISDEICISELCLVFSAVSNAKLARKRPKEVMLLAVCRQLAFEQSRIHNGEK